VLLLSALLSACGPEGKGGVLPGEPAAVPGYVDRTDASGIEFVHDAGRTPEKHLPETMGHGAALVDVDADGDLDLYLVQGGRLVRAGGPRTEPCNRLYANRGDGTFVDETERSGAAADRGYGMGVAAGDVNADGTVDLFVTNLGPDALFLGDGTGRFRDGTGAVLADERWNTGAALFDAELDGDLDLYVAAYVEIDLEHPVWCGRREPGWRTVCHPDRFPGLQDRFYRNEGDGAFVEATATAGLEDSWGKGLGVIATDLDGDGFPELYVANDSVENRLWHNDGHGRFVDETLLSGTGVNGHGVTEAGMGFASGDLDGDGDFELYVTNFDNESHTLYVNEGGLLFHDGTASAGLEAPTRLPVGFGTLMSDVDDDGDLDLFVANGHIVDLIHLYHDGQTWAQRAQLFQNDGTGRFRDVTELAGDLSATPRVGRGLVAGDLDGDGDLDLVATECGGRTRILVDPGAGGRALLVSGVPRGARLVATRADGVRLVREAGPDPSYLCQGDPRVYLGLGDPDGRVVSLTLEWGGARLPIALPGPLGPGRVVLEPSSSSWRIEMP